jgi:hypothetical protein
MMFSPSAYSMMLVDLPTSLLHAESARLSNYIHKLYRIQPPELMIQLANTKLQLIDLEIIRRSKLEAAPL